MQKIELIFDKLVQEFEKYPFTFLDLAQFCGKSEDLSALSAGRDCYALMRNYNATIAKKWMKISSKLPRKFISEITGKSARKRLERVQERGGAAAFSKQWIRVRAKLREEVGEAVYKSWVKPMTFEEIDHGEARIAVPTRFMRDWVVTHYVDRLAALWADENAAVRSVDVTVSPTRSSATTEPDEHSVGRAASDVDSRLDSRSEGLHGTEDFGTPLEPRFTFEAFVVGKPNELAHAAARRVVEVSTVSFNPLLLHGGVGLGKTHLMHAIAWEIRRKQPGRVVLYMSAEEFMYRLIRALRYKDAMSFREAFRTVDVLMIDDVQFISGKDSIEAEFFHAFNALVDQNRQIVISADKSPSDPEWMEEKRIRAQFGWGLVADIHPTTYELRLGILQAKAEQLSADIPVNVQEFLAHKIVSNVREMEAALNRLVAYAELVGRSITLELAQDLLSDTLRSGEWRVTIDEIQKRVAEHYTIKLADMHSARRSRSVARPRQVAMYLSKELTARSLPEIGKEFGGRGHTTVMHAVRKIEELCDSDHAFAEDVLRLRRMLER